MILRAMVIAGSLAVSFLQAVPSSAQVENRLAAYTGRNAAGYLEPLMDAFNTLLNSGLFHSARIHVHGVSIGLECNYMRAYFGDEDRTFTATTEHGFQPEQTAIAPTVVGAKEAVYVEGQGGTRYAFPGGFDLNSFSFAAPQIRVGTLYGTEAMFRFLFINTGTGDLGSLALYGLGLRHNISRYTKTALPLNISASLFWQHLSLGESKGGDDLLTANAFSLGFHASKRLRMVEPYAGLSYDTFSMDVSYTAGSGDSSDAIDLSLDSNAHLHLVLGLSLNLAFVTIQSEYNIAAQNAYSIGLSFHYKH